MRLHTLSAIAAAGALALVSASQAFAHAELISTNPAANSTVAAPKSISLTYDDPLVGQFSAFEVVMAMGGHTMDMPVKISLSRDKKTLTGALAAPLAAGDYTVNWHVASDDGHRETGSFAFKVR